MRRIVRGFVLRRQWPLLDLMITGWAENRSWLYDDPAGIGIEHAHCGCRFCRGLPQIFLEQHAILVDHERHHPRVAVLGWVGDEGESACHLPVDHVVLRAAWGFIALALQHTEVIAVEWGVRIRLCAISFSCCERRQRAERAGGLPFRRLSVKPLLF